MDRGADGNRLLGQPPSKGQGLDRPAAPGQGAHGEGSSAGKGGQSFAFDDFDFGAGLDPAFALPGPGSGRRTAVGDTQPTFLAGIAMDPVALDQGEQLVGGVQGHAAQFFGRGLADQGGDGFGRAFGQYRIDLPTLDKQGKDVVIMHPCPRADEIHPGIDGTRHAKYFNQIFNGKLTRAVLLGLASTKDFE